MDENHSNGQNKHVSRMKTMIPLIIIVAALAIFLFMKMNDNDSIKQSKVDGVSDEVYEQLVQWYYYNVTFMNMFMDYYSSDEAEPIDSKWFEDHKLYEEAEKYAEAHDDVPRPVDVFPNPLFWEKEKQPEKLNETELKYTDKMYDFVQAVNRVDNENYEVLKKELEEELKIKDSYNPFDK